MNVCYNPEKKNRRGVIELEKQNKQSKQRVLQFEEYFKQREQQIELLKRFLLRLVRIISSK
jgi:hypothetical protein